MVDDGPSQLRSYSFLSITHWTSIRRILIRNHLGVFLGLGTRGHQISVFLNLITEVLHTLSLRDFDSMRLLSLLSRLAFPLLRRNGIVCTSKVDRNVNLEHALLLFECRHIVLVICNDWAPLQLYLSDVLV